MNKILFFLMFPLVVFSQTTYYVDATNGNDLFNGTSPSAAWKTIAKVNNQSFIAGDQILFKRNEIWTGERIEIANMAGNITNDIIFAAYGIGEKPVITSIILQNLNWVYVANNIWKATNPPIEHPERILINNEEKLRANILSELDGVQFYWFYDNYANDLYYYSTINPSSVNFSFAIDFPLIVDHSEFITIDDIDFQGGWTAIFINSLAKNITLRNLNIGKYSREGVIVSNGSAISENPENIFIENCMFDAYFNFDYDNAAIYEGSFDRGSSDGIRIEKQIGGYIRNNYFKNWGHASVNIDGVQITNIEVSNNYLTSPDICYGGRIAVDDASNILVFNNEIINTSVQSQLNGQNNHYHHNIFLNTKNTPLTNVIDAGIELQGYSISNVKENVFENNLIMNTEGPGIRISGNNENDIYNNIFRNNIIYNCGTIINGKSIVIEENEFQFTYTNSFKNNLIYSSISNQTCWFRANGIDVPNFNSITDDGYTIIGNIGLDPMFINTNSSNFHLTSNSPCIDAGVSSISVLDFEGNSIPFSTSITDIGIYEFQGFLNIEDQFSINELITFPNPVSDILHLRKPLSLELLKITIFDLNGKKIIDKKYFENIINVSFLQDGIYIVKISTVDKIIIKKMVKK